MVKWNTCQPADAATNPMSISHFILLTLVNKTFKLLHSGQKLTPNLEGAIHRLLAENHGLRLGGADSHHGSFTLGCKPPQRVLEVTER